MPFLGGLVQIHPYVYRQVCTNGAIMAQSIETRRVALRDYPDPWKAIEVIRNAVHACAQPDVLSSSMRRIRTAADTEADIAWTRDTFETLRPHLADSRYTNFMSADDTGFVRQGYGVNYDRLVQVKRAYELAPRREGDPPRLVGNATRAREVLGWAPKRPELEDIVRSAWEWMQAHPGGH